MASASVGLDSGPGQLAGDDGSAAFVTVLDNLEPITPLIIIELLRPPIIKNDEVGFGKLLEQPDLSSVTPCKCERRKQLWHVVTGDREIFPASLVAKGTCNPTFPTSAGPVMSKLWWFRIPVVACEVDEQVAVEAACGAKSAFSICALWRSLAALARASKRFWRRIVASRSRACSFESGVTVVTSLGWEERKTMKASKFSAGDPQDGERQCDHGQAPRSRRRSGIGN